jgi:hypothetical protein
MAHVEAQLITSQSEKFYREINHTYILVGHQHRTYKFVAASIRQKHVFCAFCPSLWLGIGVVIRRATACSVTGQLPRVRLFQFLSKVWQPTRVRRGFQAKAQMKGRKAQRTIFLLSAFASFASLRETSPAHENRTTKTGSL